jgi:hypothetical protein
VKQSPDNPHHYEQDAFLLVKQALSPNATVRRTDRQQGPDAVIELEEGQELPLEFKLWSHANHQSSSTPGQVWVLPKATSDLRDRLRSERESFVDLQGTVFLSFPNLLVDRANVKLPPRPTSAPRSFDPFADRSSLVARTLLEPTDHQQRTWGVRELAEAAGVGAATVTRIVRELKSYQVVQVRRVGRDSEIRLTDARALFTLWTGAYDWKKNQSITVLAPVGDPQRFLRRASKVFDSHRWALTLHAGASLVAPHATWERIHAYVDVETADELSDIVERQGWPIGDEGRLVLMKPYYCDSVWHGAREIQSLPMVSNLQLALDLWHYPLRGREQAEHIISTQHLFG